MVFVKKQGKSFVKRVVNSFEMTEEIIRKDYDLKVFRPFVVQLLMKRNQDLFKKYLLEKGTASSLKTKPKENKDSPDNEREANNTLSEISSQELKKDTKEFSIACQTEPKSQSSDSEKFFEHRKALEKRISEEKRCQIKWIENEIHHLNILRELLEKQNTSLQKKKKHSLLTMSLNDDKSQESQESQLNNIAKEINSRAVTPVYGCTISISEKSNCAPEDNAPIREQGCHPQYGMAVSLSDNSKNWQHLVMLPVDVQLSLKDNSLLKNGNNCDEEKETQHCSHFERSSKSIERNGFQNRQSCSDMCTQYPTPKRTCKKVPVSSQTEFPSTKGSSSCNQENCFCINLSGNSSLSRSSRCKSIEEKIQMKLRFVNDELEPESSRKPCSAPSPKIAEFKCYPVREPERNARKSTDESSGHFGSCDNKHFKIPNHKCQKMRSKSESSGSGTKHSSTQSKSCKCQNCPKLTYDTKNDDINKDLSQSNIHSKCEKFSDNCHCSEIQVQKSSNCHIIKIHGSRCSSEKNFCTCRGQSIEKKTENQSCQTNCETEKQSMDNTESRICKSTETSISKSHEIKDTEEETYSKCPPNCNCKKKSDDHPRHYFLRIEEKEIDDKPPEEKKSLEVITVTIPVKKAGKSKISDNDTCRNRDWCKSFSNLPPKECNCCDKCPNKQQTPSQDYEQNPSSGYSRSRAEKPESPTRNSENLKPYESRFYDEFFPLGSHPDFSSSQQYYPEENLKSDEIQSNICEFHCCAKCNCIIENPSCEKEYDSHKRCRSLKENSENRREYEQQKKMSQECRLQCEAAGNDWKSGSRHFRKQQYNGEASSNPDYYNYNKREFMTKSEIRKEEEQKRKVHQPSLQEYLCTNRPDFYNTAEKRREIICERSKERVKRKNDRMECLIKMLQHCNENERNPKTEPKRIFTTSEMREQTMKRYKKLPEVTEKIADQKKKNEYRTNRLMADVFAKKLQIEALKGHINLSNSVSVLNTV